jgi:hypothetical protein
VTAISAQLDNLDALDVQRGQLLFQKHSVLIGRGEAYCFRYHAVDMIRADNNARRHLDVVPNEPTSPPIDHSFWELVFASKFGRILSHQRDRHVRAE